MCLVGSVARVAHLLLLHWWERFMQKPPVISGLRRGEYMEDRFVLSCSGIKN
jgi:hypothetical protein